LALITFPFAPFIAGSATLVIFLSILCFSCIQLVVIIGSLAMDGKGSYLYNHFKLGSLYTFIVLISIVYLFPFFISIYINWLWWFLAALFSPVIPLFYNFYILTNIENEKQ
jgi:hypothetical protein